MGKKEDRKFREKFPPKDRAYVIKLCVGFPIFLDVSLRVTQKLKGSEESWRNDIWGKSYNLSLWSREPFKNVFLQIKLAQMERICWHESQWNTNSGWVHVNLIVYHTMGVDAQLTIWAKIILSGVINSWTISETSPRKGSWSHWENSAFRTPSPTLSKVKQLQHDSCSEAGSINLGVAFPSCL